MSEKRISDAKRRLLDRLKRGGPATARELARGLGQTDVAIRQHLLALEQMGLVQQEKLPPAGRGRPSMQWSLTELAEGLFPDRHADLTVDLIHSTREAFGDDGLKRIVEVRARDQAKRYRKLMPPPNSTLRRKVEALGKQRSAEGYMAEVTKEEPDRYLLIEHHCPICDAAKCCTGLCSAELDVFRRTLGEGVKVERVAHLLSGDDRCVYRIERN